MIYDVTLWDLNAQLWEIKYEFAILKKYQSSDIKSKLCENDCEIKMHNCDK